MKKVYGSNFVEFFSEMLPDHMLYFPCYLYCIKRCKLPKAALSHSI